MRRYTESRQQQRGGCRTQSFAETPPPLSSIPSAPPPLSSPLLSSPFPSHTAALASHQLEHLCSCCWGTVLTRCPPVVSAQDPGPRYARSPCRTSSFSSRRYIAVGPCWESHIERDGSWMWVPSFCCLIYDDEEAFHHGMSGLGMQPCNVQSPYVIGNERLRPRISIFTGSARAAKAEIHSRAHTRLSVVERRRRAAYAGTLITVCCAEAREQRLFLMLLACGSSYVRYFQQMMAVHSPYECPSFCICEPIRVRPCSTCRLGI